MDGLGLHLLRHALYQEELRPGTAPLLGPALAGASVAGCLLAKGPSVLLWAQRCLTYLYRSNYTGIEGKSRGRKEPALRSLALTFLRPPELGEYHSHLLPRRVEGELSQRQKAGEQDRDRLAGMVLLLSPLTPWPSC